MTYFKSCNIITDVEYLRQHRTSPVCGLRSKIFRQVVQKERRLAVASQEIFVQHDGIRFKQGVRRDLCGVALRFVYFSVFDEGRIYVSLGSDFYKKAVLLLTGVMAAYAIGTAVYNVLSDNGFIEDIRLRFNEKGE